jgi:hypothetical protein
MRRFGGIGESPGFRTDRHESEPGRNHERLLRPAYDDIESPFGDVQGHGADAGDGVHNKNCVGLLDCLAHRLYIVLGTGRGFRRLNENALDVGVLGKRLLNRSRLDSIAVRSSQHRRLHAPGFHNLHPAFAELSCGADQHFVSGREEILGSSFETARTGRHQHKNIVGRAENVLQIGEDLLVEGPKIFRPMMDIGPHHGVKRGG